MHQVYFSLTACLGNFTGCRCRKTLFSTPIMRCRRVTGMPVRKIDFQI